MFKMNFKNVLTTGVSVLSAIAGAVVIMKGKNKSGKDKIVSLITGAAGVILGVAGLAKVFDEEFKPDETEELEDLGEEDYGEDIEDEFFKDLEDDLYGEGEKEDDDFGNEDSVEPDYEAMPIHAEEKITETIVSEPEDSDSQPPLEVVKPETISI